METVVNLKRETELTLSELADESGVPARTIRFYIARKLVPGPAALGRGAAYGPEQLARLAEIKRLQARGLTLAEVARALSGERTAGRAPQPSPWWQYALAEDVVVLVRVDSSPWRLRQIRNAVEQMTAQLTRGEGERDGGS